MSGVAGGQGCQGRGLCPGPVSAFVVAGSYIWHLRRALLEESGSWGDPMSGPTPGEEDRKHQKAGSPKASLPRTAQGLSISPGAAGQPALGSSEAALRSGFRGLGWPEQPGGLGQCRQRWVGTGEGACFSSLSKCGLAAVGPAGRQHMIPAAWG